MKTLRIFISSPGDVRPERVQAYDIVQRLQTKFRAFLRLEPILWEHEAMRATATFQDQILPPSKTDIVICILWARIGMRLPGDYRRPDGTVPTGTEWEFEDAYASYALRGRPDLLVYRKTAPPTITVSSDEQLAEWQQQKKALDLFLDHWGRDHEGAFKAAFTSFDTIEEFGKKLEQHLEKIINEKLHAEAAPEEAEQRITWFEGSPFRGLNVFQPEHAPIFFGRELVTREILDRLKTQAGKGRVFLMILGMSGSGKSSLARAGVLPALIRPGETDVGCWRWVMLRPSEATDSLLLLLAESLLRRGTLPELAELGYDSPEKLAKLFQDAAIHSIVPIQAALERAGGALAKEKGLTIAPSARLLLVIDQLEEIFTLEQFKDERELFGSAISTLSRSGLVWVIATMRSDLYARFLEIQPLLDLKGDDGQYDLTPPGFPELAQMVRMPAVAAGLRYETEPGSSRKVDDALLEEAWKNPESLPLLEFTLDELYKARSETNVLTWNAYRNLGGMAGAIAKRAESEYAELSAEAKLAVPFVFSRLVTVERDRATAQQALLTDFTSQPAANDVVRRFVRANLFVSTAAPSGETVVALSHEALLESWPRLRDWTAANREFLRVKARVREAAERWQDEKRSAAYLLQPGKPLTEGEDILIRNRAGLAPQEIKFVEASVAFEKARVSLEKRRRRRVLTTISSALAVAVILGALSFLQYRKAKVARDTAQAALSHSEFLQALRSINEDRDLDGLAQLARSLSVNPHNQAALFRLTTLLAYNNYATPVLRLIHTGSVNSAQFSPDGKWIVTASYDKTARVWDAQTGKPLTEPMKHDDIVYSAQFSPDGKWVVTASADSTARVWGAQTGAPLTEPMKHDDVVTSAQFSPDGKWVVTASYDKTARVWDAQTGKPLTEPMKHDGLVTSARFSSDGKRIVTASGDKTARVWDAQTGKPLTEPMKHDNVVTSAQFSPDGKWIVTAARDNTARIWDAQTGKALTEPMKHDDVVNSAQFSPDGKRIVTASGDKTARVWDAQSGKSLTEPMKHDDSIYSAQFSPDGKWIVTASWDKTARVWDAQTGKSLTEPMKHDDVVNSAQFSPDGKWIVTASSDKTARVWNAQTGKLLTEQMKHDDTVNSAQFSPDGKWIVTASYDETARVWDAQTDKPMTEPMKHDDVVNSAQFSPDGKWIVTASRDNTARVWDAQTGKAFTEPIKHFGVVNSAQFSPDGKRIVTASGDKTARVWDAQTGKPLTGPIKHDGLVTSAQFSPDGKWIVTVSSDQTVRVWDAQTGKPLTEPMKHDGLVASAQFSPDGKSIVTASWNKTARIWDAQTGKPLTEPMKHDSGVNSARFNPDGKSIVTASYDKTARLWDSQTGKPLTEPMKHDGGVRSAQFSPDGKRIVTTSGDDTRVWDAQTGKPLTEPIKHHDVVNSAQFSPDGKRVVTASGDKTARVWDLMPAADSFPEWLPRLADAIAGQHLNDNGFLEPLKSDSIDVLREIRQHLDHASTNNDWTIWGRWFLADRSTRTISPFTKVTVPEYIENRIKENTLSSLDEAEQLAVGDPDLLKRIEQARAALLKAESQP